jgi:hypothetical protein
MMDRPTSDLPDDASRGAPGGTAADASRSPHDRPPGDGRPPRDRATAPGPEEAPLAGATRAYPGYQAAAIDDGDLGPVTDAFEREAGALVVELPSGARLFPASAIASVDHQRRRVVFRLDRRVAEAMPPWPGTEGGPGGDGISRQLVYEAEQALGGSAGTQP